VCVEHNVTACGIFEEKKEREKHSKRKSITE